MGGSAFVYAEDKTQLIELAQDPDLLDKFAHVEMDNLLTLDFVAVCAPSSVRWCEALPVVFDEELGVAVFGVTAEGLEAVLSSGAFAPEHERDIRALRPFISKHGSNRIYEVSMF